MDVLYNQGPPEHKFGNDKMSYEILKIEPSERASLKVRALTVSVKSHRHTTTDLEKASDATKHILQDVSFDLGENEMLAIMGGSGSGKTTLLNILSQRLNVKSKNLNFLGSINYYKAGTLVNDAKVHLVNSYLLQDDFFVAGLTTWEYLNYHADLVLPVLVSRQQKTALLEKLLSLLEIEHLKNKVICSFTHQISFSGGERRRVSIAAQLITRPSLLFLDEPTTGLDSSTSLKLVQTLRNLCSSELGVTVILSIHQPRPEISLLFDQICLLTKGGRLVYYGKAVNSYDYFAKSLSRTNEAGTYNTIESVMKLSVKDYTTKESEYNTDKQINELVEEWKYESHLRLSIEPVVDFKTNIKVFETPRSMKISLFREIFVLTKRTFVVSYRDIAGLMTLVGIVVFLAVVVGWLFYKPTADLAGIRSYTSSLYVTLEVVGFVPLFAELERLWAFDGLLFFREYTQNHVSITGFIVSRQLGKFLLENFPISFAWSFITYFMFGLRLNESEGSKSDWSYFGIYFAITLLTEFCAMGSALLCFAIAPLFSASAAIQNIFYQVQNSGCGYFINASTMPVYVRWIKYIAYFWYAFGALSANQFTDWEGDCPYSSTEKCTEYTGNYQLEVLGFPRNWITEPILILLAWFLGFQILSGIALKFRNYDISMAKQKHNNIGVEEILTQTKLLHDKAEESNGLENKVSQDIDIVLENIELTAKPPIFNWKRKRDFKILNNISANFRANKVNVIMGPSGSGKTTLLNFISERLPKTSRFAVNGEIKLNNAQVVKTSQLKKISGYVTQYDNSLIPHLTVRETFYYQALLRLPKSEHERVPQIVNTLIRELGLVDCGDTLIGNESMKGVSGGERRRVSIGIQLLSKPKILFLDEPTSGLDSSTSVSILNLLEKISSESGTTVITTIHQPSELIFKKFGSLLLLSRGGNVIYNGPSDEIESYFSGINFSKPSNINIADYILDLVSQGMNEDKDTSALRIQHLIQEWRIRGKINPSVGAEINIRDFKKTKLPFRTRIKAIFSRQLMSSFRSKDALFTRSFQVILLGIVHTLFFAPLKLTKDGIDNRLGLIQEVLNFYFIGFINNFAIFPIERDLFYQEYRDGIYNNFEFQVVYFIIESTVEIITCIIFSALIVFAIGLPRTAGMFFSMFFTCFVSINTGESLGIMVNAIFKHIGVAMNILMASMTVAIFMGGTMSLHMPVFFRAWNYINPMKYAVSICAQLSFEDIEFNCASAGCVLDSGQKVLEYYGLANYLPGSFGGLVACFVVYRILACLLIEIRVRYLL